MSIVAWIHPGLRTLMPVYMKIRDVIDGVEAIKGYRRNVGTTFIPGINGMENLGSRSLIDMRRYLPQPNPTDLSIENIARYKQYVERAQWLGATARTLDGLTGQVFQREPQITIPDSLKGMLTNIDGGGLGVNQSMQRAVDYTMAYGRAGLLTDYAKTDGQVTQADVNAGKVSPVLRVYKPWNIVNWRVQLDGTKRVKTLVVLREDDIWNSNDKFETAIIEQYRELRMVGGVCQVTIWNPTQDQNGKKPINMQYIPADPITLLDSSGKPFDHIPFTFIGAKNNDEIPDKPPLEDLAEVNIGHYRNSADFEESVFMLGQPTPWANGLTKTWIDEVFKGRVIALGSRSFIPLPAGAEIGIIEANANNLAYQAMTEKQTQMIMLGAKLIENQASGQQTATGELVDETSEVSVLSNVANNVAAAYTSGFREAQAFVGEPIAMNDTTTVKVKLNTSFQFTRMSSGDRQELVSEWQKGAIAWPEMRDALRGTGVATMNDKDALAYIQKEQADAIATGMAFSVQGVDAPLSAVPPGQAPNPVPPLAGAAKVPPNGKQGKGSSGASDN